MSDINSGLPAQPAAYTPAPFPTPYPPIPNPQSLGVLPRAAQLAIRITDEMHKAIVGQDELVEMMIVAVLAGGHVLLEGVPGTAKTLSVRTLARIFNVSFTRIQFTPDLMPSDILGTSIFDPRTQEFQMKKGPLFAGLVLADEVNRTPPKTQSALLEAMEERRVPFHPQAEFHTAAAPSPWFPCQTDRDQPCHRGRPDDQCGTPCWFPGTPR